MKSRCLLRFKFYRISFFIFSGLVLLLVLISGCKNSTSSDTVTFSGKVTLEGETDYSGVKVMIFKPVEMDTALTNLNQRYPGVGIEINQRTEFFWREQTPVYKTETDAEGRWEIKNVAAGSYHLVYKKDGYGWQVQYHVTGNQAKTAVMKKAIIWQGVYNQAVTVPSNRFVEVRANTVFYQSLTIGAGTTIEFRNSVGNNPQIKITVYGNLQINGTADQPVYLLADAEGNNDNIKVENTARVNIKGCIARKIKTHFYLKDVAIVQVEQSRLDEGEIGLIISNCDSALVKNNLITNMGMDGLQTFDTHLNLQRNIIYDCANIGLNIKKVKNSIVQYNVFQKAGNYAVAVNLGDYVYTNCGLKIVYTDFNKNTNHVALGSAGIIIANENNFLKVRDYLVWTDKKNEIDTMNFKYNFWNSVNPIEIYQKIFDKNDRLGQEYEGPVVDISDYKYNKISWNNNLN